MIDSPRVAFVGPRIASPSKGRKNEITGRILISGVNLQGTLQHTT